MINIKYDINNYVWFESGGYHIQAQVLKIYTETDDTGTKVTYYVQLLNTITDFPFLVMKEDDLYPSKIDLLISIK